MNGRSLFAWWAIAFVALMFGTGTASAQVCRWDGTAPFCSGECGNGETEKFRSRVGSGGVQNMESSNPFGGDCATGTKALCCNTPGRSCRWDGTAPFCDGECKSGETAATPPDGSSSGQACWTGSKTYCCRVTTNANSVRLPLQLSAELSRFAAIWDKSPGPAWQSRHGMTAAEYQQEFDKYARQGYRLVDISGYAVGGQERYAAIWEQGGGPAWQARHGMTADQYQQAFNQLTQQGYRLTHISAYNVGGQDRYAAIWEQRPGPAWQARHGMTAEQYQQQFDALARQGYRPVDISGYAVGGQDRYAAIWEKSDVPGWQARHGMSSEQYQQAFNQFAQQGYRLVRISGWGVGNTYRYAAIWEKTPGPEWVARHGMVSDSYQEEFNFRARDGYRLRHVSGYYQEGG